MEKTLKKQTILKHVKFYELRFTVLNFYDEKFEIIRGITFTWWKIKQYFMSLNITLWVYEYFMSYEIKISNSIKFQNVKISAFKTFLICLHNYKQNGSFIYLVIMNKHELIKAKENQPFITKIIYFQLTFILNSLKSFINLNLNYSGVYYYVLFFKLNISLSAAQYF